MNYIEAIESVLIENYFNLDGKATRSEYWWFYLCYAIFVMVVTSFTVLTVPMAGLTGTAIGTALNYLPLAAAAALYLPLLGVTVRRFADAGRGKREAIVVFVLADISSQIAIPMENEAGPIIQAPEFLSTPAWLVWGVTALYTIYITLKKSV